MVKLMTETELNAQIAALEHSRIEQQPKARRKTGTAYRRLMGQRKFKRLYKIVTGSYIPHAGYVDWSFVGDRFLPTGLYIKYQKNSNRQKGLKRETSRRTRNCSDIPRKGNYYRKLLDYWWELY